MTRMVRTLALVALVLVALPALASAQYREYTGRVDKVDAKKLIVDNRKGDKVSFSRVDDSAVTLQEGAQVEGKRDAWEDLKKDDWVTVSWKFVDKPRKAYKVQVLPPRDE